MTPQESQLVSELFDRLESLEATPRDAQAERAIADELRRAPHAVYALVQTALVQDEALKRADARIRELEGDSAPAQDGGFLGSMRDALFGGDGSSRGSVPTVRPGTNPGTGAGMPPPASPWNSGVPYSGGAPGYAQPPNQGGPSQGSPSQGGSFLGTAASAAAGVIGGSLLLNSVRSMFGGHREGMFDPGLAGGGASPWSGGASSSDLARQAGADDVGRGGDSGGSRAGLFDTASNDAPDNDHSDDDDLGDDDFGGDDFDGGSDEA